MKVTVKFFQDQIKEAGHDKLADHLAEYIANQEEDDDMFDRVFNEFMKITDDALAAALFSRLCFQDEDWFLGERNWIEI